MLEMPTAQLTEGGPWSGATTVVSGLQLSARLKLIVGERGRLQWNGDAASQGRPRTATAGAAAVHRVRGGAGMTAPPPIRVLIADDQQLVRTGFRMILTTQSDLTVLGEASTGATAIAFTRKLQPDVVSVDIRMPDTDGIKDDWGPVHGHRDQMDLLRQP